MTNPTPSRTGRAGFVVILGQPNVGKSTLLNALSGHQLAIVTPKPQTTRSRIQAIVNRKDAQVVLVDTPGVAGAIDALRRTLRKIAHTAAADADVVLLVVAIGPASSGAVLDEATQALLRAARQGPAKIVVALNKIDKLGHKERLLPWIEAFAGQPSVATVVPISAKLGDGLGPLMDELVKLLPESPPLFSPDTFTDQAERVLCAELVRKQILFKLHDEVPHAAAVVIESFEDQRDEEGCGLCRLEGRILVERSSQKGIVVGRRGAMIRAISEAARHQIEELLGCRVYLRLTVHVDRDWRGNQRAIERLGYGVLT